MEEGDMRAQFSGFPDVFSSRACFSFLCFILFASLYIYFCELRKSPSHSFPTDAYDTTSGDRKKFQDSFKGKTPPGGNSV